MADGKDEFEDFLENLDAAPAPVAPAPVKPAASVAAKVPVPAAAPAPAVAAPVVVDPEKLKHLNGYCEALVKQAGLEMQAVMGINEAVALLKKGTSLDDPNEENRKIVRNMNKAFWGLYYNLAMTLLETEKEPPIFNYFLNYGLVDETLVSPETLAQLQAAKQPSVGHRIPVMTFFRWLHLLYKGEEMPSMNEMGVDYAKHIRELEKGLSAREKEAMLRKPDKQKAREKVKYEIDNMVQTVSRMLAGSFGQQVTLLLDRNLGQLPGSLMTAEKIRAVVEEIRGYDFSIFYRDTLFKANATSNDIVKKEVDPYFIIFPVCGDKVVFWQDLSGAKKTSRGRIFVPMFFTGDLRASMIKALAAYRWELCRTTKGTLWADPVEGGLTGAFYDYVTFFKKNSKLSIEAKEKLQDIINNNRKDPKRVFTLFYVTWIEYERRGILKLDRASREIFFKYIPFTKGIRETLSKIPAFSDLSDKYNIITNREIMRIENRYKKAKNEAGEYPLEIQETLDYLNK